MTKIEVRNLSKTYPGGTVALKNVDLDIPLGMFGLLGPNGAGKSTLMRTLATLQEADSGSIQFGDLDMLADPARTRALLGYLPQSFGVYSRVSAYDLLDHLAILKGVTHRAERHAQIEALLHHVNLYDVRHKHASKFSGGMLQRFGIAQALLGQPQIIIVDEPTAGLDPVERTRFLNLLAEASTQAAIILSTHIVEDVSELCNAFAILHNGRVILAGSPLAMIQRLRGSIWQTTIDRSALAQYEHDFVVVSKRFFLGQMVIRVFAETHPGLSFEPAEPDLKDVYFVALQGRLAQAGEPESGMVIEPAFTPDSLSG